ncbi:Por secretion system C-terminal sorting domain-containing protein [Chitinophaga sp. YR573]|uniref:T9SS type A sorting domain-containing protein n=1 Tax=Chitinophaga sp. YR573 TaxID=1881040 RepID=UPI0008B3A96E|nr:T9SS type A sorting domain-containing protein [Chitinophaga sp. YR573]SEW45740.1 Por secretion system C-terminal sorting domain-containing protein [Chitinophaga sp. YR573]
MHKLLPKGGYKRLMPLLLLFLALSIRLSATPTCPIITGTFPGANGTTVDASSTGWYLDATNVVSSSTSIFAVKSNRFTAQNIGGVGIWYSRVFSTAGYSSFQAAVKISSEGKQTSSEYVKIYYRLDGGPETLLDQRTGNFGTIDFTSDSLQGSSIQLIVKMYNYDNGSGTRSDYYIEQYRVFKEKGPCSGSTVSVTAGASNSGILTCTNPSTTLSASSSASGVTYSWTGPGSFTSTAQNPVVSTAGTYTVTATTSSASATASVTITTNKTTPDLTATGATLCSSSVAITASSSVSGATYSWTGPNGFTSTSQNPAVSTAGTYTVTVTNPANGCTATQSVTVTGTATSSTFWLEDFTFANGTTSDTGATSWTTTFPGPGTFSVQNNQLKASFTAQVEGVWTSGVIDISGKSNVVISADLISGTSSSNDFLETADYIRVYYKLNGGAETLIYSDSAGIGNTTFGTASITINSAALNGSTLQVVIRTSNSNATEQYYFDNIKLTGTAAGGNTINATVSGPLTCTTTSVTLSGSSTTSGVTYSWTGPNSFTSALQNPVVTAAGNYTLTVSTGSGCATSTVVAVTENKTAPDLTATGGSLGCGSGVTINASSTVSGATYSWTGPNSFTSTLKNPVVSTAGTYTVTVTNPANGCTASQSVTVAPAGAATAFWLEDFTFANGTTSDTGATSWTTTFPGPGTFSVQNNQLKASFTAQVEGVWTSGVIDISNKSNVVISADLISGTSSSNDFLETADYIRVYYKLNGGAETLIYSDSAGIGNTTFGTASITINSAALNGSTLQVVIRTSNSNATEQYYFDNIKLTGASTGGNVNATAGVSGVLNCDITTVILSGTSTTSGVTYSWAGPNSFTSALQNPIVSVPGSYILTVTASGGCTATATTTVTQNITTPNLSVTKPDSLTCAATSVNLAASSSTSGAVITWTGFTAGQNPVSVSAPGKYYVTARSSNGCTSIDSVTVIQSIAKPNLVVTAPATLTCAATSVSLAASSSTIGAAITWTGFTAGQATVSVSAPGKYYVTARSTTGCTSIDSVTVTQDISKPNLVVAAPVTLTCATTGVTLSATSSTSGATITWTGFTSGQSTVSVSAPGKYYVTARSASGCSTIDSVTVIQDITTPNLVVTAPATLTCTTTSVSLSATSTTTGATITWTGFTSGQNPVSVSAPGKYYVTARSTTGCITIDSVTVIQDISKPNLVVATPATLTCTTTAVSLSATSTSTGSTITWTGFTAGQATVSVSAPGKYYVTVRSTTGCTSIDSVTVIQDISKPNLVVTAPATLTCVTTAVSLSASSTTTGATITWTGFTPGQATVSVSAPGKYYVTVRSTTGCTSIDSVTVTQDISKPNLVVATPATLTCVTTAVSLSASSTTTGATITWTGFTPGQGTVSVSAPGKYYVTVRSTTGCTSIDSATVTQDISKPNLVVTAPATLTCATTTVSLNATSTTTGATITWTGFTSGQGTVSVSAPGKYYVTVRSTTGCTSIDSAIVTQNITKPNLVVTAPATLTCATVSVNLVATSSTTGATITWSGFTSGQGTVNVSAPGKYYVTARSTTGCSSIDSATVIQDLSAPAGVTTSNDGTLTCLKTSTVITATSTTPGVSYSWTGPSGFTSSNTTATVTTPGTYFLVVTNPSNGCKTSSNTAVNQNTTLPTTVINPPTATLSPLSFDVLTALSVNGATYKWTLTSADVNWTIASGATSTTLTYMSGLAGSSGTFKLKVTNTTNGCSDSAQTVLTVPVSTGRTASGTVTVAENKSGAAFEYNAYPNPFTDVAYITFKSPSTTQVTVDVYSNNGVLEKRLYNDLAKAGEIQKLTLNASGLPAGIHYCLIKVNGKVYTSRLIQVK